jgi:hypothetical protein
MTHAARKSKVSHRHDRPMPFTEKHHNTAGQKALSWKNPDAEPSVDGCLLMLRLFEGVAAAVSVVLFLSWLFPLWLFLSWLLFCRGWFSVVLLFSSWLIATPTSLPFDHSPFATRYSPFAAVLPVANRHLLSFPSWLLFRRG